MRRLLLLGIVGVAAAGTVSLGIGAELQYVVHRCDFYAELSGFDLTHTPYPYAAVGIVARFGG